MYSREEWSAVGEPRICDVAFHTSYQIREKKKNERNFEFSILVVRFVESICSSGEWSIPRYQSIGESPKKRNVTKHGVQSVRVTRDKNFLFRNNHDRVKGEERVCV